jgi:hypothetical protein
MAVVQEVVLESWVIGNPVEEETSSSCRQDARIFQPVEISCDCVEGMLS